MSFETENVLPYFIGQTIFIPIENGEFKIKDIHIGHQNIVCSDNIIRLYSQIEIYLEIVKN